MTFPKIVIIIVWFGKFPEWFRFWEVSAKFNRDIDWIIYHDDETLEKEDCNIKIKFMQEHQFWQKACDTVNFLIPYRSLRRVCDLRPFFGIIFSNDIQMYDYFGWGDMDVVYGDMKPFLTPSVMNNQVITFNKWHLNGSLTLMKKCNETRSLLDISMPDWRSKLLDIFEKAPHGKGLDEIKTYDLNKKIKVYAEESFNCPYSPFDRWRNGRSIFPNEWYWKNGILTNNIDGDISHLYLHFLYWKGGHWARQCGHGEWEQCDTIIHVKTGEENKGFKINDKGFFTLT